MNRAWLAVRFAVRFALAALLAPALLPVFASPSARTPASTSASGAEPAKPSVSLSAEERLDAIRYGLLQAALQGATRVDSVAWLDAEGRLHESSSFRSGMQVRGVQVLAYVRDADGQPRARLQMPLAASAGLTPATSPAQRDVSQRDIYKDSLTVKPAPASTCAAKEANDGLSHLIGLELAVAGRWTAHDAPLAHALAHTLNTAWAQASAPHWRVLADSESRGDSAIKTADDAPRSAYEQAMLGIASASVPLPWRMQVLVEPGPTVVPGTPTPLQALQSLLGTAAPAAGVARISLSLHSGPARGPASGVLNLSADVPLLREPSQWGVPQLSPAGRAQVQALLARWREAISAHLACELVQPQTVAMPNGTLRLNAGALAGVQAGDEWLLADPAVFPQRLLAPGVAQQLVLARVHKVHARHAELQLLAGSAQPVQSGWRAWRAEPPPAD